jgi:hypothetical protein
MAGEQVYLRLGLFSAACSLFVSIQRSQWNVLNLTEISLARPPISQHSRHKVNGSGMREGEGKKVFPSA